MGMYYQLVDPLTFTSTFALAIGGIVQSTVGVGANAGNANQLAHVCGWIAFVSFMFLIFNFQWSISAKNLKSIKKARKTYNAMYDDGSKYRDNGDMSFTMFMFAFLSFLSALALFSLGVLVLILADNNYLVQNGDQYQPLPDDKKLNSQLQVYFTIVGVITIMCSMMALIRLPLDYLLASLGIYWLLSILFLY